MLISIYGLVQWAFFVSMVLEEVTMEQNRRVRGCAWCFTLIVALGFFMTPGSASSQNATGIWQPAPGGQIPSGAVVGGSEPGRTLYLCRGWHQGGLHPGKVVGGNCNIGYGGSEVRLSTFEVLVRTNLTWAPYTGSIPPNALQGGQERDRVLYVCRAPHAGGVHPGKVVAGNCNIGYGGRELALSNFEIAIMR